MLTRIVQRAISALPVLVLLSAVVWLSTLLVPGDPAATLAGEEATPEQIATIREQLNLDEPFYVRYIDWAQGALSGDLGESYVNRRPVLPAIMDRLPVTVSLTVVTMIVSLLVSVPLGVIAAVRPGTIFDKAANVIASVNIATPSYWLAGMLVILFSLKLAWLPSIGYVPIHESFWGWLQRLILPALAGSSVTVGVFTRQTREAVREQFGRTYVRTARVYGASELRILRQEVMKNAAVPIVTTFGTQLVHLLGGLIIIERIFGLPGIGSMTIDAVILHDLPTVQGVVLFVGVTTIVVNLLVDLSYDYLAPWSRAA